jgi:hypothetical protein
MFVFCAVILFGMRLVQLLVEGSQRILYHCRDVPVGGAEVNITVLQIMVDRLQSLLGDASVVVGSGGPRPGPFLGR